MLLVLTMMGNARSLDKWERATGTGSYAFCFIIVFLPTRGVRRRFIQAHETFLIFSILATVSFLSKINAQTSTATLDHNGELTTFNGSSSFAKAMEAASEGDAIYLSAGHYDATDITKPVSIKGTGFIDDKDNGLEASVIDFSVKINLPEEKGLTIEGIRFDNTIYIESELTSSLFLHCGFKGIKFSATTKNFFNERLYKSPKYRVL